MSIVKMLEDEIALERRILSRLAVSGTEASLVCKESRGMRRFYLKNEKQGRLEYLRKKDFGVGEKVLKDRVAQKTKEILENNIRELESALKNISDYDAGSIMQKMPAAYVRFEDELYSRNISFDEGFPQSENPKDRAGLKHKTTFNLYVRSKNEVLIAEGLYASGLEFAYEKPHAPSTHNKKAPPRGELTHFIQSLHHQKFCYEHDEAAGGGGAEEAGAQPGCGDSGDQREGAGRGHLGGVNDSRKGHYRQRYIGDIIQERLDEFIIYGFADQGQRQHAAEIGGKRHDYDPDVDINLHFLPPPSVLTSGLSLFLGAISANAPAMITVSRIVRFPEEIFWRAGRVDAR